MSNCPVILKELGRTCANDRETDEARMHRHSTFVGRDMRRAERYPPRLLKGILRGLMRRIDAQKDVTIGELDVGPHVDDEVVKMSDFVGRWAETEKDEFCD
jgi:hypothetical protein